MFGAEPHARVLACAPSNEATDLLALGLAEFVAERSVRMIRMNALMRNPRSVPSELQEFCMYEHGGFALPTVQDLSVEGPLLLVCTCISSAYLCSLGAERFTHVFVDEAGEALEPETLVPLVQVESDGVVMLSGDHKQLGPIVSSPAACEYRLDR